ncbi:transposase, partial [Candidatus Woesebacteria bacterium]|nr:transposase [Candidatus Woesebacteria bacterium]
YQPNSYFHIYNRGNNKEEIFFSEQDYEVFRAITRRVLQEEYCEVIVDTFCLMPNHFHFLVYQVTTRAIEILMRKTMTRYVMYINKKYGRVGRLFQDIYKAAYVPPAKVAKTRQYILDNPINAGFSDWKHVGRGYKL